MATISYVVFKHHKKQDNTFNVKFRITHKGKQVYFSSVYYVSQDQLRKDYTIKDVKILDSINADLATLRRKVEKFGFDVENMTAADILREITRPHTDNFTINFIDFIKSHLDSLQQARKSGTYRRMRATVNHLSDFAGAHLDPRNITSAFLREFDLYLRSPRTLKRKGQRGTVKIIESSGLDNKGVKSVMVDFNTLFNLCCEKYNSEFITIIKNQPFDYYKIPKAPRARKRGDDMSIEEMIAFRDAELTERPEMARDIFFLSFYMCGMNAVDIYNLKWDPNSDRIEYERSKTRSKRHDRAFISIKVPDVARPLLIKYNSDYLQKMYTTPEGFLWSINQGLPEGISFYHARHFFATWARNVCRFHKDDVAKAMNHVDNTTITDRYITTDWSIIDRVQEGVIGLLGGN